MASDQEEREVLERLLERAKQERAKIDSRIEWLETLVAEYRTGGATSNGSGGDEGHEDDDDGGEIVTEGYGAMKKAVHRLMLRAGKRLRIPDIATIIEQEGIRPTRKAALSSAHNAVRAMLRNEPPMAKKIGAFYKAI